ncbi:MAG: hypothetical protein KKA07_14250 [Bacteroidetes bacterium]|nr:hypothetical protein [Bacteroidota bacterium]MBU1720224.1 hypothetical protein [Bacteroidota bacterium]
MTKILFPILIILFGAISPKERIVYLSAADDFTTDHLGNIYVIKKSSLVKYTRGDSTTVSFSNIDIRDISYVDAKDPLKILVFDKENQKIAFIDNSLSLRSDIIFLSDLGFENITNSCSSQKEGFWIYDASEFQISRYDSYLKPAATSGNIVQVTGKEIHPVYMLEENNNLYINDPEIGLLVFDVFGTFIKTIRVNIPGKFQVRAGNLIWFDGKHLKTMNLIIGEENFITLPKENITFVRLEQDKLFIRSENLIREVNISN